ncbi:MAG: hypothetical protein ACTSW1_04690, partial [Candidatus Hodarchaeales archaeon]
SLLVAPCFSEYGAVSYVWCSVDYVEYLPSFWVVEGADYGVSCFFQRHSCSYLARIVDFYPFLTGKT